MAGRQPYRRWMVALASAAALGWAAGAGAEAPKPGPFDHTPVVPELAVDGAAVVGGKVVATMAVMARETLADVRIQVELPQGVERTDGELSWNGPMAAGEIRIMAISAKLAKPGRQQIVGRVTLSGGAPAPIVLTTERWLEVKPNAPATPRKK